MLFIACSLIYCAINEITPRQFISQSIPDSDRTGVLKPLAEWIESRLSPLPKKEPTQWLP